MSRSPTRTGASCVTRVCSVSESVVTSRVVVVGGGAMGEAIVSGWLASGVVQSASVTIAEPSEPRRKHLERLSGVRLVADASDALPADIVLIAVKPQVVDAVLGQIGSKLEGSLVVSIAAGVTCARLEATLPVGSRVVRVMPNMPAMVSQGMAVLSAGSEASEADIEIVQTLFGAIGSTVVVAERYQNAATAISGSGPAYFALVVDALSRAGVAAGLSRDVSQALAVQTMLGTAQALLQTGMHPEAMIDSVASPGGTTIAALGELEAGALRASFAKAVKAAVARAEELS